MPTVTCYYDQGCYYLEPDGPDKRYRSEAAMYRRADELGHTHVVLCHGKYVREWKLWTTYTEACNHVRRAPKRYRKGDK